MIDLKKIIGILVVLLIAIGCIVPTVSAYSTNTQLITVSAVRLRKTQSAKAKTVVKLKKGTKVTSVAKSKSGWVKVKTSSGKTGYVQTKTVKAMGTKKTAKITFYCACPSCNGSWSSWRSGAWSTATAGGIRLYNKSSYKWKYCAATPSIGRLGQTITVYLDGAWRQLKIVDRMGSSYGNRIDVFYPGHSGCYAHGVHWNKAVYVK